MRKLLLCTIIISFICPLLKAQNISGIVNSYTAVTNINQNVLTVNSSAGFLIGDKVMVIKMKGATINQTNTAAYGDTILMDEAGKYIFSNIIALTPTTVTLSPFCDVFNNNNYLQMVSVPQFANPVITATLTCLPWDGSTGGILIFEASGTLTCNADIDCSNLGYRGGDFLGGSFSCGSTNYFSAFSAFANEGEKGEGIADWILGQEMGKGKLANGGGGAYAGNTGAGGGANGGKGGDGGYEYSGCGSVGVYSIGAQAIAHKNTALIMGGGGGGPQRDNGQPVFAGGNGGGIIYIKANQIAGNNFTVKNNGGSVPTINDEGSGAGGAGGSMYFICPAFTNLNLQANGGDGGSNNNVIFSTNCHGPGGGGSGGLVWFSAASAPAGVSILKNGGLAGKVLNPLSTCFNTNYGAQPGDTGIIKYNFVPPPPPIPPVVNLGADTTICAGTSITLNAGAGFSSYLWDNLSTSQTRIINAPGTYYVTITTATGCTGSDTIIIGINNSVQANFTYTVHFGCDEDTVDFINTSAGASLYVWDFDDGNFSSAANPTHIFANQGSYNVMLVAGFPPCSDTIVKTINISHPVNAAFSLQADSICVINNAQTTSTSVPANALHTWNWGDGFTSTTFFPAVPVHNYSNGGTYTILLTVTDTLGCTDTMSRNIYVEEKQGIFFTASDDQLCVGEPVFFSDSIASHTLSFAWNYGDGSASYNDHNPSHAYDASGSYVVSLVGDYTICADSGYSVTINVADHPNISLGKDTSICPGITSSILLTDINNAPALYEWSTGETSNAITVTQPGHYWVKATTSNSDCATTDSIWIKRDCYINVPNSFSPNGDGLNDYFLPRELLSEGVRNFKMNIFNRWGELIFTCNTTDGRGWDGKYNGELQNVGVYIYIMDVEFMNSIKKTFQGNVSLLR